MAEIHDSISDTDKEHGWLYLPKDSLWVDTTVKADDASVEHDQYAHIFLSYLYPETEHVHTHPDATVRQLAIDEPWSFSHNHLLEAALPSGNDFISHSQMAARTSPDSRSVSTVVSHHGATSFFLNDINTGIPGIRID